MTSALNSFWRYVIYHNKPDFYRHNHFKYNEETLKNIGNKTTVYCRKYIYEKNGVNMFVSYATILFPVFCVKISKYSSVFMR